MKYIKVLLILNHKIIVFIFNNLMREKIICSK